ncbi:MAG TPA: acetyl-CoA carboxylase biotin carboxyl carrier protein [Anaeromyxobacteraceae bacterium]|nr:acetyl-CoA carboxylase biotin carboxyl carrier protein [Anaeromyxobacteraceae bacterium]
MEQEERGKDAPVQTAASFTLDEVTALVKVLEGTDVTSLRWKRNGEQIAIRRGHATPTAPLPSPSLSPAPPVPIPMAAHAPASRPPDSTAAPAPKAEAKPGIIVSSPFVGTFYRSPSPDSPAFVDVGTAVKKGQVLCIVEAMKLMNEIEAEVTGKVAEILAANATPVEFGQALFRIEPG